MIQKCRHKYTGVKDAVEHTSKYHGAEVEWICLKCSKKYKSCHGVASHFSQCRSPPSTEDTEELEYKCIHCDKSFEKASGLGLHKKRAHPVEFELEGPALKKHRVTEADIDLIAQAAASIPASVFDQSKRQNLDIKAVYEKRFEPIKTDRINNIRKKHRAAYEDRLEYHRNKIAAESE